MRSYKGGKKFLIKANIKQDKLNLYDENEKKLALADYDTNNEIIPLLNINGIRFSKSSFVIDIMLVQFMVLYPSDRLENQLLIKINKKKDITLENSSNINIEVNDENSKLNTNIESKSKKLINTNSIEETSEINIVNEATETNETNETSKTNETSSFKYLINDLETKQSIDDSCELEITDLDITENSAPLELKSHESIYLDIYRKAKQKAKEIRRNAVEAFLEAKNIKIKYNLTNIVNDSSSDEEN
jgi:hypothetical protein